jgi:hypothetical protein
MKKNIEAVENAITFLEALGYEGGDIHDDLVATLRRLRQVQANRAKAEEIGRQYAQGLPADLSIATAETAGRAAYHQAAAQRPFAPAQAAKDVL